MAERSKKGERPAKPSSFTPWRMGLVAVFFLAVVVYLPSLKGQPIWDDQFLLSGKIFGENTVESALFHPFADYFRPLTSLSFVIDSSYARGIPFYYHQTNIILHALTSVFVACLAYVITQKKGAGIAAGLFFAAQPMQVSAAGWIGGRTDTLSTLFLSIFLVCLVQYHRTEKRYWYGFSLVLFLLAAFSKEQAIAIFPVVPLSVFAFGTKKWRDMLVFTSPFLIATIAYFLTWRSCVPLPHTSLLGLSQTASAFFRSTGFYGFAVIIPTHLGLMTFSLHNFSGPLWISVGVGITASVIALIIYLWKTCRELAWITMCGLFVYLPVANIIPAPSLIVAPYRTTQSGIAVACLLGAVMWSAISKRRLLLGIPVAANFAAGLIVTFWGASLWMNSISFFSKVYESDPHFIIGTEILAQSLISAGHPQEAAKDLNENLTYVFGDNDWVQQLQRKRLGYLTMPVQYRLQEIGGVPNVETLSDYVNTYAFSLARSNRVPEAREAAKAGLTLWPKSPKLNYIYGLLVIQHNRAEAIRCWELAMKSDPNFSRCGASLGHERVKDGAYAAAIPLLKQALPEMGYGGQVWLDLTDAQIETGDLLGAQKSLQGARKAMFVPRASELEARQRRLDHLLSSLKKM